MPEIAQLGSNVIVDGALQPPTGLAAGNATGNISIPFNWDVDSGATSYKLYRGSTVVYNGSTNSFTDTLPVNSGSYSYSVTALSGSTETAHSSNISVNTNIGSGTGLRAGVGIIFNNGEQILKLPNGIVFSLEKPCNF